METIQKIFEVEKKFSPTEEEKRRLLNGAKIKKGKIFKDIYYDTLDFKLTTKDIWLRERGGCFELKVPYGDKLAKNAVDHYEEITNLVDISNFLKLEIMRTSDFKTRLERNNYDYFCAIKTNRTTYEKEGFNIDVNEMDFGYSLVEIEKVVLKQSEMSQAEMEIMIFAKQYNLKTDYVRGKVIEYLFRNDKKHFNALVRAGVARG